MKIRNTNASEILIGDYKILYSYKTPVAAQHATTGDTYRTEERYSVTTTKHLNQWLKGKPEPKLVGQWMINQMAEGELRSAEQ